MTKEQFDVLLKAKHIMPEQADDAIAFLKTLDLEESVNSHYKLYLSAYNSLNFKVAEKILASLVKYLPKITDTRTKGIVYSMMVADAISNEKYNNAISIYYEYKKLNLEDDRLDYNFDNFMLNILGENMIYPRYRKLAESFSKNPYITKAEPYNAITFYYNSAVLSYDVGDIKTLEACVKELEKIKDSGRETIYPIKGKYIFDLLQIFLKNAKSKTRKEKLEIANQYKVFINEFEGNSLVDGYTHIEAHLPILEMILETKDYAYVRQRINKMLKGDMPSKIRIKLYQLLCEVYRQLKDEKYLKTLQVLTKLLLKQQKKDQKSVNEGLINSIRFYEVQQSYNEIQQRYETDQLTGCYSRNVLYKKANKSFANGKAAAMVFFDLDDLKETNDEFNHSYGDQYLRSFVKEVVNLMDQGSELFRYGGDEFVLIVRHNDASKIEEFIKSVISRFAEPIQIYEEQIKINFSAGIALYPQDGSSLEELLKNADNAMYQAKKNHLGYLFHKK